MDTICSHVRCAFLSHNKTGLSTPRRITNKTVSWIKSIPNSGNYTFIDFGCGDGDVMKEVYPHVSYVNGVDIEEEQCRRTRAIFKHLPKATIYHFDMADYHFANTPTILYMYEPLWMVNDKQYAMSVYHTVFTRLSNVKKTVYIINVTGVLSKDLDHSFFTSYGFSIATSYKNPRFVFNHNLVQLWKR